MRRVTTNNNSGRGNGGHGKPCPSSGPCPALPPRHLLPPRHALPPPPSARWLSLCAVVIALLLLAAQGAGADRPGRARTLPAGASDVWDYDGITAATTGDPAVADITPLSTRRLLVNARSLGETTIIVFDKRGRHSTRVTVAASDTGLAAAAAQAQADIGLASVSARAVRDVIFLEGTVATAEASQRAAAIAGIYSPRVTNLLQVVPGAAPVSLAETYAALINETWGGRGVAARAMDAQTIALTGTYTPPRAAPVSDAPEPPVADDLAGVTDAAPAPRRARAAAQADPLDRMLASLPAALHVVDLLQTGARPVQQILVRAKVIDIARGSVKQLGVQWGTLSQPGGKSGFAYTLQSQPILFGQTPKDQFVTNPLTGGGPLSRFYPFAATLTALINDNKARILSEPSLLVRDGAEGSILVGGEIPVPVAQTNNGFSGATVSVEYKPYGVRLHVQPDIVAPGTIELTAAPEVSDLDYGNGVNFNGLSIPALTVRRATSTLQLRDGETLVIGGLYSSTSQRQVQRIPLLSQVPVLGEFFKYSQTRKEEDEILILLSVEIVTPDSPDIQPPAAGSTENLLIPRPDVPRHEFEGDFPELSHLGRPDPDQPKTPVSLPPTPSQKGTAP